MNTHAECIQKEPLKSLVDDWTDRGKSIKNLHDLILRYYTGIKIICIPHSSSDPSLVLSQYRALVTEVHKAVEQIVQEKKEAEILLNSEDLDVYFEHAFYYFSQNPSRPFKFNFLETVFRRNPVQAAFTDQVNLTAKNLTFRGGHDDGEKNLETLVASSILLDVRHKEYPQTCQFLHISPQCSSS